MGGSKGTSSSGTGPTGTLSFIPGLLANAFLGTQLQPHESGFVIRGAEERKGKDPFLFEGQGASLDPQDLISNITDLAGADFNQGAGGARDFLGLGQQGAGAVAGTAFGNVLPTLEEGLETGFKPDLDPIIEAQKRQFFREIVPGIQQQNVFANEGGAFGSDVTGQLFNAGKDLSVELGGLETGLQQQAGQTRADLAGISGTLLNQLQGLPFEGGFSSLDLGEQLALQGTAGGRQAQILQLLAGINPSQPIQSQSSKSKTSGGGV